MPYDNCTKIDHQPRYQGGALMSMSVVTRWQTFARCNFACYYCKLPASVCGLEVDHVMPSALGGTDDPWNLVAACPDCNRGKGSTLPSPELRAEVWALFMASKPEHVTVAPCHVCGQPTHYAAGDPPESAVHERCEDQVIDAYEHGWRGAIRYAAVAE